MENIEPMSVAELNQHVKTVLEKSFSKRVRVIGEVSNLKSGRDLYFSLKDGDSIIKVVVWSTYAISCPDFDNGEKIIVDGYVQCYAKLGYYQINGRSIEMIGVGELQKQYAKMKERYEQLGYFDPQIKKPLPEKIRKVGVLTSLEGAALQDFMYVLKKNRFIGKVSLKNCAVQGKDCPKLVAIGLKMLDQMGLDIIVVTRGGGSLEDLFGFSHPTVIEAIYQTKTPTVSAIGHEVDTMLSDLVADIRAPTPSIAGEIICSNQQREFEPLLTGHIVKESYIKLAKRLSLLQQRLSCIQRVIVPPNEIIKKYQNRVDYIVERSEMIMRRRMDVKKDLCNQFQKRVKLANPDQILNKGYCLLSDESGNFINSLEEYQIAKMFGQKLKIRLKNGYLIVDPKYVTYESFKSEC